MIILYKLFYAEPLKANIWFVIYLYKYEKMYLIDTPAVLVCKLNGEGFILNV